MFYFLNLLFYAYVYLLTLIFFFIKLSRYYLTTIVIESDRKFNRYDSNDIKLVNSRLFVSPESIVTSRCYNWLDIFLLRVCISIWAYAFIKTKINNYKYYHVWYHYNILSVFVLCYCFLTVAFIVYFIIVYYSCWHRMSLHRFCNYYYFHLKIRINDDLNTRIRFMRKLLIVNSTT